MEPFYVMLCGLPGSGKTTIRRQVRAAFAQSKINLTQLSTDDLIELEASRMGVAYEDVFGAMIDESTKKMNVLREAALKSGANIIHDQTNIRADKRRERVLSIPKNYVPICLVSHSDDVTLKGRFSRRQDKVMKFSVWLNMKSKFQYPTTDDGFAVVERGENWRKVLGPWLEAV
jgi:tRNA uridine 5-carbamoylmethylation protein Kti12